MERIDDGPLGIVIAGPAGFGNNIFVVVDTRTGEAAFVDAPDEATCVAAAEFADVRPGTILLDAFAPGPHTGDRRAQGTLRLPRHRRRAPSRG